MGMLETIKKRFDTLSATAKLAVVGTTLEIVGSGAAATSWTICDLRHQASATIVEKARETHLRGILEQELDSLKDARVCHALLIDACKNLPKDAQVLLPEVGHLLDARRDAVFATYKGLATQGICGAGTMPSPDDAAMIQQLRDVGPQISDRDAAQNWAGMIVAWSGMLDSAQGRCTLASAEVSVLQALQKRK